MKMKKGAGGAEPGPVRRVLESLKLLPESLPFERFEMGQEIGHGRMSTVFRAIDRENGGSVAIKMAGVTASSRIAIRNEAMFLGSLSHGHVVGCLGGGTLPGGRPFIALELLEGETLAQKMREGGTLPWGVLGPVMLQLCDALEAVHSARIIHRDIKPENIFLTENGIKLIDFGVSQWRRRLGFSFTLDFTPGNGPYAAPEVYMGRADCRSDIFALGVLMQHALAGEAPDSLIRFYARGEQELGLPPPLSEIAEKAMELDPRKRFCSAKEMREEIEKLTAC